MDLIIEIEREEDGRWIAEVPQLPGVLAYGATADHARCCQG
jgi:predicted RNase H-like HicB family nuclease